MTFENLKPIVLGHLSTLFFVQKCSHKKGSTVLEEKEELLTKADYGSIGDLNFLYVVQEPYEQIMHLKSV